MDFSAPCHTIPTCNYYSKSMERKEFQPIKNVPRQFTFYMYLRAVIVPCLRAMIKEWPDQSPYTKWIDNCKDSRINHKDSRRTTRITNNNSIDQVLPQPTNQRADAAPMPITTCATQLGKYSCIHTSRLS